MINNDNSLLGKHSVRDKTFSDTGLHVTLTTTQSGSQRYFKNKDTRAQRGQAACLGAHSSLEDLESAPSPSEPCTSLTPFPGRRESRIMLDFDLLREGGILSLSIIHTLV